MRPALRQKPIMIPALLLAALLAGCGGSGDDRDGRPPQKPEQLSAAMRAAGDGGWSQARISTRSGEILILEPDGTVTTMALDSESGRSAFEVTEADLAALNANLDLNLAGSAPARSRSRGPTAQERAIAAFAARTRPALPALRPGTVIEPEDFIAARVDMLDASGGGDLVEVTANLRKGVDADIAFSYATCALAGWARDNGGKYGRHIRTLQQTRDGKLLIGAAFTVSDSRPLGLRVMETDETLRECKARGIPAA